MRASLECMLLMVFIPWRGLKELHCSEDKLVFNDGRYLWEVSRLTCHGQLHVQSSGGITVAPFPNWHRADDSA